MRTKGASRLMFATHGVPVVPGAPTSLSAFEPASGSIGLKWAVPASNGNSAITDYSVQYRLTGAGSWTTWSHSASTATTITITGLTNGSSYDFQVAAVNVAGTGTYSSTVVDTPINYSISLVGSSSAFAASGTSVSLTQVAGIASGDFGLIACRNLTGGVTAPSGWTQLTTNVFWRKYNGSETDMTITTPSGESVFVLGVFRGTNATPLDTNSTLSTGGGVTTLPTTAITATNANELLLATLRTQTATTTVLTVPSGYTEVVKRASATQVVGIAFKGGFASSASSGTPAWNSSVVTNGSASASLIFVKP